MCFGKHIQPFPQINFFFLKKKEEPEFQIQIQPSKSPFCSPLFLSTCGKRISAATVPTSYITPLPHQRLSTCRVCILTFQQFTFVLLTFQQFTFVFVNISPRGAPREDIYSRAINKGRYFCSSNTQLLCPTSNSNADYVAVGPPTPNYSALHSILTQITLPWVHQHLNRGSTNRFVLHFLHPISHHLN